MKVIKRTILNPPSDNRLNEFQLFHQVRLPMDFIDLIKYANGAEIENLSVDINGQERLVERFLCILDDLDGDSGQSQYEIGVVIAQIEDRLTDDEELVGTKIIPFALLFGGDFLCLDFRSNSVDPSVIIWDHEESDELSPITYFIANSISTLLEK